MQKAVIIDLDGTLVNNTVRTRFVDASQIKDWDAFNRSLEHDTPSEWCRRLVYAMASKDTHIIFLTARTGSKATKDITSSWLTQNMGELNGNYTLLMRDENDTRPDFVSKQDIYTTNIMPYYEVLFAVDDKSMVCNMWRSLGITTLHCEDY
jgi:predicted secreted acid phosphatase